MNQRERDRLGRQEKGDRRFFVRLFGFLAGLLVLGLIAIAYVIGFSNGKDEGRKVQPAAARSQPPRPGVSAASSIPAPASEGKTVQITMSDDFFTPKNASAKAGSVTISTPNTGQLVHEMVMAKTEADPPSCPPPQMEASMRRSSSLPDRTPERLPMWRQEVRRKGRSSSRLAGT
jgi:hypothetical protein